MTKNMPVIGSQRMATRRHTFSHYHLDYTPVLMKTDNPINFVMEAGQTVWYNPGQINTLGLPAPIKQLLQQHTHEENNDENG